MGNKIYLPVCQKLIQIVRSGFNTLDIKAQHQLVEFITSRQDDNGGFRDRSDRSDLYYSVFGYWLGEALNLDQVLEKHKVYIRNLNHDSLPGAVDRLSFMLIRKGLFRNEKKNSLLSLIKTAFMEPGKSAFSYRIFLFMLAIDPNETGRRIFSFFLRIWLYFYKPTGSMPCSVLSALIFVKSSTGLDVEKEKRKLITYHVEGSGFKAFDHMRTCDLLSTAVALFVLREADHDLRLITPDCLHFIEMNYKSGAFLPGNGDMIPDLEYTFYGLLALGSLVTDYEE